MIKLLSLSGSSGIGEVGVLGVRQLVGVLLLMLLRRITHLPHSVLGVFDANTGPLLRGRGQHGTTEGSQGMRGEANILTRGEERVSE